MRLLPPRLAAGSPSTLTRNGIGSPSAPYANEPSNSSLTLHSSRYSSYFICENCLHSKDDLNVDRNISSDGNKLAVIDPAGRCCSFGGPLAGTFAARDPYRFRHPLTCSLRSWPLWIFPGPSYGCPVSFPHQAYQ
ncbi:hypothetical protein VTO42DRAFT_4108 [Malbranchea cinnamomea]